MENKTMREKTQTFFGMTGPAFTRPPKFPYLDPTRTKAVEQLRNLIQRRGFSVLTAPPGCGKTAILHYLSKELSDNQHKVIYVPFSFLEKGQMLSFISAKMGLEIKHGMAATISAIQKHLHDIQPVNPVIIIDEIERMDVETTHIIRLIANDRQDTIFHSTLILAGDDSFVEQKLRLHINEPLRQRITLYVRLQPLDLHHTELYVEHSLSDAGASQLFEKQAIQLIHELTNGVLRIINTLAEAAIDLAAEHNLRTVTLDHVHQAAASVLPPQPLQVLL
jgi:type II secretory pathway predicted ATPase ExeA